MYELMGTAFKDRASHHHPFNRRESRKTSDHLTSPVESCYLTPVIIRAVVSARALEECAGPTGKSFPFDPKQFWKFLTSPEVNLSLGISLNSPPKYRSSPALLEV